jgi:hypothetical protein
LADRQSAQTGGGHREGATGDHDAPGARDRGAKPAVVVGAVELENAIG